MSYITRINRIKQASFYFRRVLVIQFINILLCNFAYAVEQLDTIIVTASKREDDALKVPISLSVFEREDIDDLGFLDSSDIAQQTLNLQWRSQFGSSAPNIFIRGIGNSSFHSNSIGPVAIYRDGVYQGSNIVHDFPLFDQERVEVLRGPQGTLFGRNSTGGLVHYISRKPELDAKPNGRLMTRYGSYNQIDLEAALGIPLGENAAARFSVVSLNRDGIFDNINPASGIDDTGDTDILGYRGLLRFQPTASFDLLLNVHGGRNHSIPYPRKQIGMICPAGSKPGLGGSCTDRLGQRDSTDFHETLENLHTRNDIESYGANFQATWNLNTVTLTSISAFDHANVTRLLDADQQPSAQLTSSYDSKANFWSQEFRLNSDDEGPYQWIAGLYYYQDHLTQWEAFDTNDLFNVLRPNGPLSGSPVPEGIASDIEQQMQSFAAFGEISFQFLEHWKLTAGLRWTYDRRKVAIDALLWDATNTKNQYVSKAAARNNLLFNTIPPTHPEKDWNDFSSRMVLEYAFGVDQTAFASASRGFKGGQFNGGAFTSAEATLTNPEYVNNFELGYKGRLFDGRLQLNTTAFYSAFDDQQVFLLINQNLPQQKLVNAGASEIKGVEAEIQGLLDQGWFFRIGAAYLDARFTEFTDPLNPAADFSGNRLPDAPKWNVTGLIQYDLPTGLGIFRAQSDFFWNSRQFFSAANDPALSQNAYGVVNARLAWTSNDQNYQVSVWVKNIADEEYFTFGTSLKTFGWNIMGVGDPRTIGVTLRMNFD